MRRRRFVYRRRPLLIHPPLAAAFEAKRIGFELGITHQRHCASPGNFINAAFRRARYHPLSERAAHFLKESPDGESGIPPEEGYSEGG
jgi:hypothetical protein